MIPAKIFVVTGPESSGKTYLSQQLAAHFDLLHQEEYARSYLDTLDRKYLERDLITIAKGQYDFLNEQKDPGKAIIMDTDGLTLKIWSEEKFGRVEPMIVDFWKKNLPSAYLLCKPDIPWVYDPQRENPTDRHRLFSIYEEEIMATGIPYIIIEGNFEERYEKAKAYLYEMNG